MPIKLRKAGIDDCRDLFAWRNDPVTRQVSFNSGELKYEDHEKWFKKYLQDPDRSMFIAEAEDNEKLGMVRFDRIKDDSWEISINLSPAHRGKGLGSLIISKSCELFAESHSNKKLVARTKASNIASIKAFEKAGFCKTSEYDDAAHGKIVLLGRVI